MKGMKAKEESVARGPGRLMEIIILLSGLALLAVFQSSDNIAKIPPQSSSSTPPTPSSAAPEFLPKQSKDNGSCLSLDFDSDMDKLMEKYKQVFVVMPPKAAGTTYEAFASKCQKSGMNGTQWKLDHAFLPSRHQNMEYVFKTFYNVPSFLASHVRADGGVKDLIKHATRDSLIIFSHREETSRYISGIKEELQRRCNKRQFPKKNGECFLTQDTQDELMKVIKEARFEIHYGGGTSLTCETYDILRDNAPNFAFVHFTQTSKIQKLLAKHHCPDYQNVVHSRKGDRASSFKVIMDPPANENLVPIDDWLHAKREMLEYTFQHRQGYSCVATTRDIEDELFACPDEALQIYGRSYDNERIRFPL
eukprot:CAMPEP_0116154638 /NCGR_PEP_ID=MMETSP0329-20121206/21887_1 /TAXON_ID=697910 /ORGANISM="Pseudo-nitzschia arenysensis, Strain B593" /LENGTH=363 /DNA_ID=CAMNT_0003651631 /DNA_START=42 /DNA_END=1133 /DNA_ORIENTATION=+